MKSIREISGVTPAIFEREIRASAEPAIFRGLADDWPLVGAANDGDAHCAQYLKTVAAPRSVEYACAPPDNDGRLHYNDAVSAPNFLKLKTGLSEFLDMLLAAPQDEGAERLAIQGLLASEYFPEFEPGHAMALVPRAAAARLWIGGRVKVATHSDPTENVAVVAAGRRRFTLFPPEEIANLYLGPFHITPAGTPVSMAHLTAPDFKRFPRLADALQAGQAADLEPGDAIYIPYHWYHHVESQGAFNVLVNYWWDAARPDIGSPWDALMHGMMTLRQMPPDQRRAWRAMFDHYVFLSNGDPGAHLPPEARGILAANRPQDIDRMRRSLIAKLQQAAARR